MNEQYRRYVALLRAEQARLLLTDMSLEGAMAHQGFPPGDTHIIVEARKRIGEAWLELLKITDDEADRPGMVTDPLE